MKKIFVAFSGFNMLPSNNPRIVIPSTESGMSYPERFEREWILKTLSQWGAKSTRDGLLLFDFPPDGRRFSDALSFLLAHGYDEVSDSDSMFHILTGEGAKALDDETEERTIPEIILPLSSRDIIESVFDDDGNYSMHGGYDR